MQPRDLELLLVLNNKSNYNEKDFQNEIEYLMINKYIYRKGGCMNLTDKAKDFIKRQVKEKPDVEDLMNCTDHLLRIKIVRSLWKQIQFEDTLYKLISKARERERTNQRLSFNVSR